jgi:hypothetical protein
VIPAKENTSIGRAREQRKYNAGLFWFLPSLLPHHLLLAELKISLTLQIYVKFYYMLFLVLKTDKSPLLFNKKNSQRCLSRESTKR